MTGRRFPAWFGKGFNLDEAYEFLDGLGLLTSAKGEGGKTASLNASTLNALLQSGRTGNADQRNLLRCARQIRLGIGAWKWPPQQGPRAGEAAAGQPHCRVQRTLLGLPGPRRASTRTAPECCRSS